MSNLNGHINPLLDNDSESMLADDEGSDIDFVHIDSPDVESVPEITMTRSTDSSSDITVSSLSLLSTEHSTTEETSVQEQDKSQISDISQRKNISEKEAEKIVGSDTEILLQPLNVKKEKNPTPNISSTSKTRALDSPSKKMCILGHNVSDMATIPSEDNFKKFKAADDLEEMSSPASSYTSFKPEDLEKENVSPTDPIETILANTYAESEDKIEDQDNQEAVEIFSSSFFKRKNPEGTTIETDIKDDSLPTESFSDSKKNAPEFSSISRTTHKDTEGKLLVTSKITTEKNPVKFDAIEKLQISRLDSQICSVGEYEETENLNVRKGEKRKMSSPETIEPKIKMQKPSSSSGFISSSPKGGWEGDISCSNLTSEEPVKTVYFEIMNVSGQNILPIPEHYTEINIPDSDHSKEPEECSYTTVVENSEISVSSTGVGPTSGTTRSSEEQAKIDVGKLSPDILDEDALLSAPEKSDKFIKTQTTAKYKEDTLLKEVKLNISACVKNKDDSQSTECTKEIERNPSENESTDTEHSIIRQESESASSVSYDQEILKQTDESSFESQQLSVMIARRTETPALIEENAMISPPERMKETSKDFSELCETEIKSSKERVYIKTIDVNKFFQEHNLITVPLDESNTLTEKSSDLPESSKKSSEETLTSSNIIKTASDESLEMVGTECRTSVNANLSINEQDETQSSVLKFLSENVLYSLEKDASGTLISTGKRAVVSSKKTEKHGSRKHPCSSEQGSKVGKRSTSEKTLNLECETEEPVFSSESDSNMKEEVSSLVRHTFSEISGCSEQKEATSTHQLVSVEEESETLVEDVKCEQSFQEEDSSISEQKK